MNDEKQYTFINQVQRGYRIWIPKSIRNLCNINVGDYVEVKIVRVIKKGILRGEGYKEMGA